MLLILGCSVLSGAWFYLEALKNGMPAGRWGVLGLLLGPALYPLFRIQGRMHWRRVLGRRYGVLLG